jgi:DNA-binding NarL/FixJ family response regulator
VCRDRRQRRLGRRRGRLGGGGRAARGAALGLDARDALRRADSGTFLAATGDALVTGPTGTNVMDLVLAWRREASPPPRWLRGRPAVYASACHFPGAVVPLRILIIDDHRDYRTWLSHHLAAAQPDAVIVEHDPLGGDGALPAPLARRAGTWCFSTTGFGERDGLELLRELKALPACPPVVFLTPQGDQQAIVRALEEGADDFLPKGRSTHQHISRVVREAVRRGDAATARRSRPPARRRSRSASRAIAS